MDKLNHLFSIVPCHRKKERTIHIKEYPFPICARCTGILLGYLSLPFLLFFSTVLPIFIGILLNIPMIIDGYTQKWGLRLSNNKLRLITGILCGLGQSVLIIWTVTFLIKILS